MTDNTDTSIVLDINHINLTTITLAKTKRNQLLEKTDKYLLSDYPITPENLELIKSYRQMLRNFINTNKDLILSGEKIEIPEIPKI